MAEPLLDELREKHARQAESIRAYQADIRDRWIPMETAMEQQRVCLREAEDALFEVARMCGVDLDGATRASEVLGGVPALALDAVRELRAGYDEACTELEENTRVMQALRRHRDTAEATIARVDARHQPQRSVWYQPCAAHHVVSHGSVVADCPNCRKTPQVECVNPWCDGWPCSEHLALHDETTETCTHAGESAGERPGFGTVKDDHGSTWEKCSPTCDLQVVRPGKVQCNCEEA